MLSVVLFFLFLDYLSYCFLTVFLLCTNLVSLKTEAFTCHFYFFDSYY